MQLFILIGQKITFRIELRQDGHIEKKLQYQRIGTRNDMLA